MVFARGWNVGADYKRKSMGEVDCSERCTAFFIENEKSPIESKIVNQFSPTLEVENRITLQIESL